MRRRDGGSGYGGTQAIGESFARISLNLSLSLSIDVSVSMSMSMSISTKRGAGGCRSYGGKVDAGDGVSQERRLLRRKMIWK